MTRPRFLQLIPCLVLLLALPGRASASDLVLAGATLVDVSSSGNSTADIKDSVVIVHEGRIAAAGPRSEVKIPAGARVIDVSGKYIVPGLNDAFSTVNNQAQANACLYMGVTSIVGLIETADDERRGPLFLDAHPGPRIYRLDWQWQWLDQDDEGSVGIKSEAELIEKIDALARSGVKVLLLHYGLTPEQVRVAARHARELGMATIGELGATTYAEAVQAGVNAFVHTSRYSVDVAPPDLREKMAKAPGGLPQLNYFKYLIGLDPNDPALQRHAATLASGRVGLISTLSAIYLDLPGHRNLWKEPAAAILDPEDIHLPANPVTGERDNLNPTQSPRQTIRPAMAQAMLKLDEQYRKAGAKFVAGSGADAFGAMPGISLHTELELLARIGLTPRQALAAATSNFGELFGWSDVGQVKAGFNADLLVLDADPAQDVRNLAKIRMVILNGEVLDREALLRAAPPDLALTGGTLVDVSSFGNSTADIKDSVVVVHKGRIAAAGPRSAVKIPSGARMIDISGKYVVPGLTDAFSTLNNQSQANALLYMGVTSIIGVGEPPGGRRGPLYLDVKPSPRIYRLDWEWSPDATISEAELLQKIDALARSGVKALLLHYGMTPAQVRVTARRARQLGMVTIGEFGQTTYAEGIEAGVNALVHTSRYSLDLAPPDLRKEVAEEPFGPPMVRYSGYLLQLGLDDPVLQRHAATLASGRVGLIPTASMLYLDLPGHENPWKEPIAAILDPKDIHFPVNPATGEREGGPPPRSERAMKFLELDTQYRKAGAKFLAGSGADAFGLLPGIALHTELALLTRIGLTPRQALAAATGNVSELLGWSEIGQLKAGSNADLLVLDADPTQDIKNLKKIRMVLLGGEILDRERFLQPLPTVAAGPPPPSLYERIAARLARDPALAQRLESPPRELANVSWMLGSWDVTARVFATASTPERVSQGQSDVRLTLGNRWLQITDTYPDGGMDEGFLTYNPVTQKWVSVIVDVSGNAVISTARGWLDNRIVFQTPEIEILGEKTTLQQTISRRSATEYHVLNEEKLPDGRWVPLDEYTYRKRSEAAGDKKE